LYPKKLAWLLLPPNLDLVVPHGVKTEVTLELIHLSLASTLAVRIWRRVWGKCENVKFVNIWVGIDMESAWTFERRGNHV
jgi:hypothetical protein